MGINFYEVRPEFDTFEYRGQSILGRVSGRTAMSNADDLRGRVYYTGRAVCR